MNLRSASRSVPHNATTALAHRVSAAAKHVLHTNSTENGELREFAPHACGAWKRDFLRPNALHDSFEFPPSSTGVRAVETPHFHPMRTPLAACLDSHSSVFGCDVTPSAEPPFPERRHSPDAGALSLSRRRASDPFAATGSDRSAPVRSTESLHRARNALTARLALDPVPPSPRRQWLPLGPLPLPRTPTGNGSSLHWSTHGRGRLSPSCTGRQG
jgi:hypothetical protein